MGRQNGEASVASSSIALLQERFRELQRIREKRQEKELLKLFSSSSESEKKNNHHLTSTHFDESSKLTFQPDHQIISRTPALQDSLLSLTLNSQTDTNHSNIRGFKGSTPTAALWPDNNNTFASSSRNFDNSDVDTSLHL